MAEIVSTRLKKLYATNPRVIPVPIPASQPISGSSPGGATIGEVSNTAHTANTVAQGAAEVATQSLSAVGRKLSRDSADVLAGVVSFANTGAIKIGNVNIDANGNIVGGSGFALTCQGLVGAKNGVPNMVLTATGDASLSGSVYAGGSINLSRRADAIAMETAFSAPINFGDNGADGVIQSRYSSVSFPGWGHLNGLVIQGRSGGNVLVVGGVCLSNSGGERYVVADSSGYAPMARALAEQLPLSKLAQGSTANFSFSLDNGATWTPIILRREN